MCVLDSSPRRTGHPWWPQKHELPSATHPALTSQGSAPSCLHLLVLWAPVWPPEGEDHEQHHSQNSHSPGFRKEMSILQKKHQQWPVASLDLRMFHHQQPLWKRSCCSANGHLLCTPESSAASGSGRFQPRPALWMDPQPQNSGRGKLGPAASSGIPGDSKRKFT